MRFFCFFYFVTVVASVHSQNLDWAFNIGGSDYDFNYDLTTDNQGNIFIAGEFHGPVDFDPGSGSTTLVGDNSGDAFIAKYDSSMNFQWVKHIQSSGEDWASSLKCDGFGNVIVTGMYTDTVYFLGTSTTFYTDYLGWNVFIAKYSSSGTLLWATQYGGRGTDESYHLELGNSGDIYISGMIQDSVKFNSGTVKYQLPGYSGYTARFDSTGFFNNLIYIGSGGNITDTRSVKIDASGNVYCTGTFGYKAFFDSGLNNDSLMTNGMNDDIYLAKYDNQGVFLWAIGIGGSGSDYGEDLLLDNQGDIYLTGNFWGTVDFDPGSSTNNISSFGDYDMFLAKYDNSGNHIWAKKIGGTQEDWAIKIIGDNNGLIYLTGYFYGTADFDPDDNSFTLSSLGSHDVFISAYNINGELFWAQRLGSAGLDYGVAFSLDPNGAMVLSGGFESTVDFDFSSATSNITSQGMIDCFISRYHLPTCRYPSQPNLNISSNSICFGDSVYLTISPSDSLYDAQSWVLYTNSCNGVYLNSNSSGTFGFVPQSSTTYYMRAEGGCIVSGSCSSSNVVVTMVNTNVSQAGGQLMALANNVSYQWYDCDSQTIIPGATGQNLNSNDPGNFSVIITDGNCVDTSICYEVFGIGIYDDDKFKYVNIYPNPNQGLVNIDLGNLKEVSIKLYTARGRLIYQEDNITSVKHHFEFNSTPGLYFIELNAQGENYRFKLVKE